MKIGKWNTSFSLILPVVIMLVSCVTEHDHNAGHNDYLKDETPGIKTGGVRVIPIVSGTDTFNVWTKRIGNNPKVKLLLLSGGPGCTHEYFECMESFLPAGGIEFIYYDQVGTGHSDNPDDSLYWDLDRYVEEVEQVRAALNLDSSNFFLLGHSWGGILAMQYALKYQQHLKGLIVSNMMASCPKYDDYANEVLAKQMDPVVLDSIMAMEQRGDFDNPQYMALLEPHFYQQHICRIPLSEWPEPMVRSFDQINASLYVTMQGPSEFGIAGRLTQWDVSDRLKEIVVPTLVIGATHDTMDPAYMKWMSKQFPQGSFLLCKNGSHMCMWDDQETYMDGLMGFLRGIEN
ncbi:MAG: proline iminopeptidase-family hydrolase [Flavobacteriales bacterium]|nr:proline iminopeptidase-family hydrolase [Flavobacteriales bacterium]